MIFYFFFTCAEQRRSHFNFERRAMYRLDRFKKNKNVQNRNRHGKYDHLWMWQDWSIRSCNSKILLTIVDREEYYQKQIIFYKNNYDHIKCNPFFLTSAPILFIFYNSSTRNLYALLYNMPPWISHIIQEYECFMTLSWGPYSKISNYIVIGSLIISIVIILLWWVYIFY